MNTLSLKNKLPSGEDFIAYLNGQACSSDIFTVPSQFHLKLVQYRVSAVSGSALQNLGQVLAMFLLGGRKRYDVELSSPGRAVWDADCEVNGDATLNVSMIENAGHIVFQIREEGACLSGISSIHEVTPQFKWRWLGLVSPFSLGVTAVFLPSYL